MYIIIAVIVLSILLGRQARRHAFEKSSEFKRLNIPIPKSKPKLPKLEAYLNILLGVVAIVLAADMGLVMIHTHDSMSLYSASKADSLLFMDTLQMLASLLATGIVLMILGIIAVRRNILHEKEMKVELKGAEKNQTGSA